MHRVAILPLILLLSCASSSFEGRVSNVQTTESVEVEEAAGRAAVTVKGGDTIVEICGMEFTCKDYKGWLGKLSVEVGSVRVGALRFVYDEKTVRLFARRGWTNIPRDEGKRWSVDQGGQVGRNVFR